MTARAAVLLAGTYVLYNIQHCSALRPWHNPCSLFISSPGIARSKQKHSNLEIWNAPGQRHDRDDDGDGVPTHNETCCRQRAIQYHAEPETERGVQVNSPGLVMHETSLSARSKRLPDLLAQISMDPA
jgi:hypothetical protein